jgi:hypothetical protein
MESKESLLRQMRDCKHGQLARSCEICDLESQLAAAQAEIVRLSGKTGYCLDCERQAKELVAAKAEIGTGISDRAAAIQRIVDLESETKRLREALASAIDEIHGEFCTSYAHHEICKNHQSALDGWKAGKA